jgi:predicted nucleotidyltransferase
MDRYNKVPKGELVERAKELECLYLAEEALAEGSLSESLEKIAVIIPMGFRSIYNCTVIIELDGHTYNQEPSMSNVDVLGSAIIVKDETRGFIRVMYPKHTFADDDVVFLDQEIRLLNTIAKRIAEIIDKRANVNNVNYISQWKAILNLLQRTDHRSLLYVCEKMLAMLAVINPAIVQSISKEFDWVKYDTHDEINFPLETLPEVDLISLSNNVFDNAVKHLNDTQIYDNINLWIYQGKTYDLIKIVDKKDSDVNKISQALSAYMRAVNDNDTSSDATRRWLIAELTRRYITDNPSVISKIHEYINVEGFINLLDYFICSPRSIGRIGGKGSGLFLAYQILKAHKNKLQFENIFTQKTWYISSDEFKNLLEENGLDELNEHKYLDMVDIRISYPRIIQRLKNAHLSPYILNELNKVLDNSEACPLIVRSSSLLEDQIDTSFSGKYKSLFITNIGTRAERMKQLTDGILEVYASIFNPDSIEYRKERGLLDCDEQMGIMIQEVVGCKVGTYYFPLFAGVAFSNNELRWSHRIKRDDGLLRMVMGLGTRAVDRVGEDYPVLLSPGQPNLRINQSPYDLQRYSPQYMDVIDLENNQFLTLPIADLIKEYGNSIPNITYIASVIKDDIIIDVNPIITDFRNDNIIITFDKLINKTPFVKQVKSILSLLQTELGYPVDIEFACDDKNFYLLQCRPQSRNHDNAPVAIPINIPNHGTVFTANKYVSNGKVTGIKTIIYVDPYEYSKLGSVDDFMNIRNIISELNKLLPRKSFILMGPGRWGSRGDIKLGVPVAYSDINNTAMLIEIALKQSKHEPELSFGTHFFQDLVEENIKYLPLYPEDSDIIFNQSFFRGSKNVLSDTLPMYSYLSDVVKVIKASDVLPDNEMIVLMNGDLQKAIAYLEHPSNINYESDSDDINIPEVKSNDEDGWKWRHYMAEQIASRIDMKAYSVKGIYLFGSTNNCTARLNSDIDLLIHFDGNDKQKEELDTWLMGWSMALSEINYLNTGYKSNGLLDIHYVTDQDIKDKTSFAIKINSVFDPASPLRISQI